MAEVGRLGFLVGKAMIDRQLFGGKLSVIVGSNFYGFTAPKVSFWDHTYQTVEHSFHTRGVMMNYQPKQGIYWFRNEIPNNHLGCKIVDGSEMKSQTTTWDVKLLMVQK